MWILSIGIVVAVVIECHFSHQTQVNVHSGQKWQQTHDQTWWVRSGHNCYQVHFSSGYGTMSPDRKSQAAEVTFCRSDNCDG